MFFHRLTTMGWPFIIIYLALIALSTYFAIVTIPKSLKTKDWVTVQGKITDSRLVKAQHTKRTGQRITVFSATIDFEYGVDGNTYTGSRKRFADRSKDGAKVRKAMLARFPIGETVPVYYNPNEPSEAVLVKGLAGKYIFAVLVFLIVLAGMTTALMRKG